MGFKLIRVDEVEPFKIPLPVGIHFIGRGVLLNCDDLRVSRKHGVLIVSNDTVQMRALHPNPCFYNRSQCKEEVYALYQGDVTDLTNGCQFGLLLDRFWFELIYCQEVKGRPPAERPPTPKPEPIYNTIVLPNLFTYTKKDTLGDDIKEAVKAISRILNQNMQQDDETMSQVTNSDYMELEDDMNWGDEDMKEGNGGRTESSLIPGEANNPTSQPKEASHQADNATSLTSPSKRPHTPDADSDAKKVKTEPESPKEKKECSKDDVKIEPHSSEEKVRNTLQNSTTAGPIRDLGPSYADRNNNASTSVQPPSRRERCIYGASCYRLNPMHKAQFSHPSDRDYGSGDKGVCPFGASCYRRDPRHWNAHSHPPGATPPPPPPPIMPPPLLPPPRAQPLQRAPQAPRAPQVPRAPQAPRAKPRPPPLLRALLASRASQVLRAPFPPLAPHLLRALLASRASQVLRAQQAPRAPLARRAPQAPRASPLPRAPHALRAPPPPRVPLPPRAPQALRAPPPPRAPHALRAPLPPRAPQAMRAPPPPRAPQASRAPHALRATLPPRASQALRAPPPPRAPHVLRAPPLPRAPLAPLAPHGVAPQPDKRAERGVVAQSGSNGNGPPSADLIVDGKRNRKPVKKERCSDSEEEGSLPDPYATDDDSDEWEPPNDGTRNAD